MTMKYKQTRSFGKSGRKKRGSKVWKRGLSGNDYALVALAIIAVILMLWLFVDADRVWCSLTETTTLTPMIWLPKVVGGDGTPGPRPTLTAGPRPTLESERK